MSDDPRDQSDLFAVRSTKDSREIPRVTAIPKTKEEVHRLRVIRLSIAASLAILAVIIALVALHLRKRSEIDSARVAAERDGRPAELARLVELLALEDNAADRTLLARAHAAAALEGIEGHLEPARALLAARAAGEAEGASDQAIALTYLALTDNDPAGAAQVASGLAASGPRAAEAAHARALAAEAIGNLEQAIAAATAAVQASPDSPRHDSLLLVLSARGGGELPNVASDDSPARALARARAAWDRAEHRETISPSIEPIVARQDVTPRERAWAMLLLASSALDAGELASSGGHLERAIEAPPPGDEIFRLHAAELALALDRRELATTLTQNLRPDVSADPARRAEVLAGIQLAAGQLDAAASLIEHGGTRPGAVLIRARIAEARRHSSEARALYTEASQAPFTRLAATLELARLALQSGQTQESIALLTPLLAEHPTHGAIAAAAATAHGQGGDPARGLAIADAALAAHPREPVLLAAKARIHIARAEWQPALAALRTATEVAPRDPSLARDRGRAAQELGELDEARAAYASAIESDPRDASALTALLALQVRGHDLEGARQTLDKIDSAQVSSIEIDRLRGAHLVDALAGDAGVREINRARRGARRDQELALALAKLQFQAERWYDSIDLIGDAMPPEGPEIRREIALLRLLAYGHAGRTDTVEQLSEAMRDGARDFPLTPTQEARLNMATAWAQWHDEAFPRAAILARTSLALDPSSPEALLLLGMYDELQHRDPSARYRAAIEAGSVEALGRFASSGSAPDPERCAAGRRYLRAAPEGAVIATVRERLALCPPE